MNNYTQYIGKLIGNKKSAGEGIKPDTITRLSLWIDGKSVPTFNQLEEISKSTGIPLGYFFLENPPVEDIPLLKFRAVENDEIEEPSRELLNTIHQMESVQDWIKEYKMDNEYSALSFVGSMRNVTNANLIAEKIKEDLNLDVDWYKTVTGSREAFNFIKERLSNFGITVMVNGVLGSNTHKPLSVKEFRAFVLVDDLAPLIFINGADSKGAMLFSLLHEVAHIWLGVDDLYNDWHQSLGEKNKIETICNSVAAQIIVPNAAFNYEWDLLGDVNLNYKIENLADIFHCSITVIARKLYDKGIINQSEYEVFAKQAIDNFLLSRSNGNSSGNFYTTVRYRNDGNFMKALYESVMNGRTLYTEAYRLTNTNSKTFKVLAESMGVHLYD